MMEDENINKNTCNTSNIKAINLDTVHKICSGQVVLSLAIAVKELVENSLDAGATNIEVRLKNHGTDLIEVSDNGSGITEDNFAALTLKYHTSKLNDYSELLEISSFGFRGEALSSLCALANLTITTRHRSCEYATKLEYDLKGNIIKKTPCSRQIGTTVTLTNLFHSLPVRQKEFHKNAKREFNKMTQLLYAYCLISVGVKITCSNQTNSNVKTLVVATQGSNSYKDNISCVFGIKQLQSILEIKPEYVSNIKNNIFRGLSGNVNETENSVQIEDVEIDLSEDSNDAEPKNIIESSQKSQGHKNVITPVEFTGYISSCAHGSGRSSTDRQFFFINNRPCEPMKIMKMINEIYRQFNPNQYPFVFLNVNLDRTCVDVNVTPDKRKIFLTKEKLILNVLKQSLEKLFENIPSKLKIKETEEGISFSSQETNFTVKAALDQPRIFNSFLQQYGKSQSSIESTSRKETKQELKRKSTSMLDFISAKSSKRNLDNNGSEIEADDINTTIETEYNDDYYVNRNSNAEYNVVTNNENKVKEPETCPGAQTIYLSYTDNLTDTKMNSSGDVLDKSHTIMCKTKSASTKSKTSIINVSHEENEIPTKNHRVVTDQEDLGKHSRKTVTMKTSLDHVRALSEIYLRNKTKSAPIKVKFRSEINPVFNKKCEEELSREISKHSFKEMKVVGQFNLGFIITILDDDLFIIDQHATDEIYNFETLQRTTEITSQKLVIPQQLELTGVNEQILMDNLDIFKKNGFTFDINESALPTRRVKLLTLPMSKNWIFGKEDIEELLFMLRESPSEYCRPSRVRAMFASRACRKSVMIGTALSNTDMKKLVDHMAEIDKPWNCPHGRPTIRHLVNVAMIHTQNDKV